MNQQVREMLDNTYDSLRGKFPNEPECWDKFLEFVTTNSHAALLNQLEHKFEWLFEDSDLCKVMLRNYDNQLMRSDLYDYLGAMYESRVLGPGSRHKPMYTPEYLEARARSSIAPTRDMLSILDPNVKTGRALLAAYKQAPNAIFFGAEKDLRLARIAMANLWIHGIRGFILVADKKLHDLSLSSESGRYNWGFSNKWNSHLTKLRPVSDLPATHSQP